jgi:hypothetical protein
MGFCKRDSIHSSRCIADQTAVQSSISNTSSDSAIQLIPITANLFT